MTDTPNGDVGDPNAPVTPPPPPPTASGSVPPAPPMQPQAEAGKWFEAIGIVILSLVCCWPLGLVLLWTNKKFTQKTKLIVTGVIVGILLIGGIAGLASGGSSSSSDSSSTPKVTTQTTATTLPRVTTTTVPPTTTAPAPVLTKDMCVETPPQATFQKDGGATIGQCLHFWATVFQFDANTGPCAFLASYGSSPFRRNYEFSNAIIKVEGLKGAGITVPAVAGKVQLPNDSCTQLGPIADGDEVEVWAINLGQQSYSTTTGGSNTYTLFGLVDAYKY